MPVTPRSSIRTEPPGRLGPALASSGFILLPEPALQTVTHPGHELKAPLPPKVVVVPDHGHAAHLAAAEAPLFRSLQLGPGAHPVHRAVALQVHRHVQLQRSVGAGLGDGRLTLGVGEADQVRRLAPWCPGIAGAGDRLQTAAVARNRQSWCGPIAPGPPPARAASAASTGNSARAGRARGGRRDEVHGKSARAIRRQYLLALPVETGSAARALPDRAASKLQARG